MAKLEIVEKEGLTVLPQVARHCTVLRAKEVMHEGVASAEGVEESTFSACCGMAQPFYVDDDLEAVDGQASQVSLPCSSGSSIGLRYIVAIEIEDADKVVASHRDAIFNDAAF